MWINIYVFMHACVSIYKVFGIYCVWRQSPICDGPLNLRGWSSFVSVLRQLRSAEISVLDGHWCVRKRVASNTVSLRALWVYDLIPLTAWSKIVSICWLWSPFISATTRDICLGLCTSTGKVLGGCDFQGLKIVIFFGSIYILGLYYI